MLLKYHCENEYVINANILIELPKIGNSQNMIRTSDDVFTKFPQLCEGVY